MLSSPAGTAAEYSNRPDHWNPIEEPTWVPASHSTELGFTARSYGSEGVAGRRRRARRPDKMRGFTRIGREELAVSASGHKDPSKEQQTQPGGC